MENHFDKDLKDRLGDASLPEAGLRLDKDKLWSRIEKKKAKKRIAFLPWVSHAAAIAAGLALGIFFFTKGTDENPVSKTISVQQQTRSSVPTVHDTVYIVRTDPQQEQQHQQPNKPAAHSTIQKATPLVPQQKNVFVKEEQPNVNKLKESDHAPETVFAGIAPRPVKVLHLRDMDNENACPRSIPKSNLAFLKTYLEKDMQGQSPETFSILIGKTLNSKY
jgi:hypothetical protein